MPGEEHSALVYKWRLLPDFWLNNGFSPQEASIATLCRVLHRQRIDLFTIISSPRNFVECLYCDVSPVPILPVLYRFIKSPVIYRLYILTFTHSYIQTFIHSHIHTYIHTYIHTIIHSYINTFTYSYTSYTRHHSYMVASVTQNFVWSDPLSSVLTHHCVQAASSNKRTA